MNGKFYIKKFIRSDGATLSFDQTEIFLDEENTLLMRPDPETSAVNYTEVSGGEMISQKNPTFEQDISGLIVPKHTAYWELVYKLTTFFKINYNYKIIYIQKGGKMFSVAPAWISRGLQIPPVAGEEYARWQVSFEIGDEAWREYSEDAAGKETYANSVELSLISGAQGGECWDTVGAVWNMINTSVATVSGASITIPDAVAAAVRGVGLYGNTEQNSYSGKNLLELTDGSRTSQGLTVVTEDQNISVSGTATGTYASIVSYRAFPLPAGTYSLTAFCEEQDSSAQVQFIFYSSGGNSQYNTKPGFGTLSTTITADSATTALTINLIGLTVGKSYTLKIKLQIEKGSPTSYEPYVGGISSPNPDYPQSIQTTTGRQIVNINDVEHEVNLGKNLFNKNTMGLNGLYINLGNWTMGSGSGFGCAYAPCEPNTTYTISKVITSRFAVGTSSVIPASGISVAAGAANATKTELTITTPSNANYLVVFLRSSSDSLTLAEILDTLQIEKGDTATDYAGYFTPIELCKINDYQDRIYKSDGKWYLYRAVGKYTFDGTETATLQNNGKRIVILYSKNSNKFDKPINATGAYSIDSIYCSNLPAVTPGNTWDGVQGISYDYVSSGEFGGFCLSISGISTLAEYMDKIVGYRVCYILSTPTTAEITNKTLIEQLEKLGSVNLYAGENNIEVESADLPAELEVKYWTEGDGKEAGGELWVNGEGGIQDVVIASTDTVYPVWVVDGECVNPTLQDNTTGTIAKYNGTIASGQTLTVDFESGVAYLDNALVTRNVEGLVKCAPGINTIGFNSDGGSTTKCKIKWNNRIG